MQSGNSICSSFPENVFSRNDPLFSEENCPSLQCCKSLPKTSPLFKITDLNYPFLSPQTNDPEIPYPNQSLSSFSSPPTIQRSTIKKKWTPEEDELLIKAVETYGKKNWSSVATLVPGRNPKQCRERWTAQINPSLTKQNWTPEEDQLLINLQQKHGNLWAHIALFLPGRSGNSVKNRFNWLERRHLTRPSLASSNNADSSLNLLPIPDLSKSAFGNHSLAADDAEDLGKNHTSFSSPNHSESMPLRKNFTNSYN